MTNADELLAALKRGFNYMVEELNQLTPEPEPGPDPNPPFVPTPPAPPQGPFTNIDGKMAQPFGIYWGAWEMDNNKPRIWKKQQVKNHTNCNIQIMAWKNGQAVAIGSPVILEDIVCDHASATPPQVMDGTGEANMWIGTKAEIRRVKLTNGAWMGLWTGGDTPDPNGGCNNSIFEDFEIVNQPATGVYIEHVTHDCRFSRFKIECQRQGIISEWWYGGRGSYNNVIEDFDITVTGEFDDESRYGWGITLDAGTYGYTIRNGIIRSASGKYLELPEQLAGQPDNVVENVVDENGDPVEIVYHNRPMG